MTLKELLNNVLAQSSFLERSNFAGSSDPDDRQMVAIANKALWEVRDFYPWPQLRRPLKLYLVTGTDTYLLPNDFRNWVPNSGWMSDGSKPIELPVPDGRWYRYRYSSLSGGGLKRCRLYGDSIIIDNPATGEEIDADYITDHTIKAATGDTREQFTKDDDTCLLDDRLMVSAIQAHWAMNKGFPQAQIWMADYRAKTNEEIGRVTGGRTIGGVGRRGLPNGAPYYPLWRE